MQPEQIQSQLPKEWEREASFHESFYDWMDRSPFVAISAGFHFVAYFLLLAIPWNMFQEEPITEFLSDHIATQPKEIEPPDPKPEEIVDPDIIEPTLDTFEVSPTQELESVDDIPAGDPSNESTDSFDTLTAQSFIGIGGPTGDMIGDRGPGSKGPGGQQGEKFNKTIKLGLQWLRDHQSEDGYWDVDEFALNNLAGVNGCREGAGIAAQDIGITGLALLAFLGEGSTTVRGEYQETVKRGIGWLLDMQDLDTGLIGENIGHAYVYDHAIATLALAENCMASKSPIQRRALQKALNFIGRARDPYGAWRYDVPSEGESDTSITGWMVFALKAGQEAGLKIDTEAFPNALAWIDSVTDETNGRVGYIGPERGGRSSRTKQNEAEFDPALSEAMTGVGLLTRAFLGQTPEEAPIMRTHGDLMLRSLPEWDAQGKKVDMYYWYYGTYAMYQLGGEHWAKWRKAMPSAVLSNQRSDGDYTGSWDPAGPWGYQGGRVYSTATMVLTLQVYYRYSRLLGAR